MLGTYPPHPGSDTPGGAGTVLVAMSDLPPPPVEQRPPWLPPPPGAPARRPYLPPPPPPPTPGDPGDGSRSRGRRWALAALGLLVIVGLVASAVLAAGGGAHRGSPAPTTTPAPADRASIERAVADISGFVEHERGLKFKHPVTVQLLGEGQFQDRLLKDFDDDAADMRKDEVLMKGLGLVDPGVDLVAAMRSLLGAGVVGFYDPETKALVVRGAALTPYVRTTIAHELTHALDDQWFDLDRPQYDKAADEVSFGFSALAEGDARRVENAYRSSLSEADKRDAAAEELQIGAGLDLRKVPLVLVDLIGAPYSFGEVLVDDVVRRGGKASLGRAFGDPPHTSEQVLDPDRFADREGSLPVPHPRVPGTVIKQGVAGELLIQETLESGIPRDDAATAAEGWGGDWAVAWKDGPRPCTSLTVVGDDAKETGELRDAFRRWADSHDGARITGGTGGAPVNVASCAAG